ncbi:MAG: hypothetical protein E7352_01580 [Clostridiales bacterium]|nr:hypothetical protein [Clostridiales bacterium]
MKLEKREITLNETDSLKDVYYTEKTLLREYSARLTLTTCQETKHELSALIEEVTSDMEKAENLMQKSAKNTALIGG